MVTKAREKRKKPPTFQHYPASRAQKLKKAWVENKKIITRWKAQKHKEGSLGRASAADEDEGGNDNTTENEATPEDEIRMAQLSHSHVDIIPSQRQTLERQPVLSETFPKTKHSVPQKSVTADATSAGYPSLRDLKKTAYSRNSLHAFKSDSLHRKSESRSGQGEASVKGKNDVGRNERAITRGKGQPNMKLRMNVLLEKIKSDLSR